MEDERLEAELRELYQSPDARIVEWASVIGTYALHREHRGPVDGWAELWPHALVLWGMAVGILVVSTLRFHKRLA